MMKWIFALCVCVIPAVAIILAIITTAMHHFSG